MILIISSIVILAIILVTIFEVMSLKKTGSLNIKAMNSFYTLPRKKKDTKQLKTAKGDDIANLNSCSYSFMVRTELSTFNDSDEWVIFYRGDSEGKNMEVKVSRNGDLTVIVNGDSIVVNNSVELRTWTHVVICLDNTNKYAEVYINGYLFKTMNLNNLTLGTKPLEVNPDSREAYIQNLKYYPDVLSSQQIKNMYEGPSILSRVSRLFSGKDKADSKTNVKKCTDSRSADERIKSILEEDKLNEQELDDIVNWNKNRQTS